MASPYVARLRDLGRLYQRAVRNLDDRDLRAFALHQSESFLHPSVKVADLDDRAISVHVEETADFLRHLIALHPKPRRLRERRIRLLD